MAYQALTPTVKAERKTITLAGKEIEVFRMPNGEYRYSIASATKAVNKLHGDWANYQRSIKGSTPSHTASPLNSETLINGTSGEGLEIEALQVKGSTPHHPLEALVSVGRTRIRAVTDVEVSRYWKWKFKNGSQEADALLEGVITESLDRRANAIYGTISTLEQDEVRTTRLTLERLQSLIEESFDPRSFNGINISALVDTYELSENEKGVLHNLEQIKRTQYIIDKEGASNMSQERLQGYLSVIDYCQERVKLLQACN